MSANQAIPQAASDLLIENARVIDGTGAEPEEGLSILIRDERIAAIGREIAADGVRLLDATGLTLMPGLIDAHVHLAMVPGSLQRDDAEELSEQLTRQHLRAYLANGVTTVLEAGIPTPKARQIVQWTDDGHPAPRILMLSPFLTAPSGYLSDPSGFLYFPPVETPQDIEDRIADANGLPSIGIKIPIDRGSGKLPIHSPEMRLAITEASRTHELPIFIHSMSEEAARIGIEMGARTLMHAHYALDEPSDELIELVQASGAYLVPTFANRDAYLIAHEPERLDDPLVQLSVPAVELQTARAPGSLEFLATFFARGSLGPDAAEEAVQETAGMIAKLDWTRDRLANEQNAVRRMHAVGVPIVLGSDSGNFPMVPYVFHGPTTRRELQLMEDAGLTRMEVIEAATRVAAEMLGIDREAGSVEVGKCADLLIMNGNPLEDLSAVNSIVWTIRAGVARTPEEWMTSNLIA